MRALNEGNIEYSNPRGYYAIEYNVELACHVSIKIDLDMARHSKHHLSYAKTIKVNIHNSDLKTILKDGKTLSTMAFPYNIINDITRHSVRVPNNNRTSVL